MMINLMYILFIGVITYVFITDVNSTACDEGWLEYQGNCLKYYSKKIHGTGAYETCLIFRNALLVTVDNLETSMFVQHNLTSGSDVWIGLSIPDISKTSWKWSDGGNTSYYDDWIVADVTSACAVMKYDNNKGHWYTRPCAYENYYVCEKEMSDVNCSDWLSFETHCYLIITESTETNMAAGRNCWQYDAYLISINSQLEADFIYSKLEKNSEYWNGLSPLKWSNDAPYQWNNWDDSGPSITYTCVYMDATSGKWFYEKCGSPSLPILHHSFICQKDAVIPFPTTPNAALEVDDSTNNVLSESYTAEFDALNLSYIQGLTDDSKPLLLTALVPAVCGGLVFIIVIIVVVIIMGRRKRKSSSQDEPAIYYNDITKTRDNGHVPTEDSHTSSAGDTERNTYEQLSVGPYVNSGQIQAGTYASLQ